MLTNIELKQIQYIHSYLMGFGHSVWMDAYRLDPDEHLEKAISSAIEGNEYFIACVSEAASEPTRFVYREIQLGLQRAKRSKYVYLVPVIVQRSSVPAPLEEFTPLFLDEPNVLERIALTLEEGSDESL